MEVINYPKTYFKNLDAPRFLSFLLIFLGHVIFSPSFGIKDSSVHNFLNQHLIIGIDFYTILSGFLITWIILEEYHFTTKFSLSNFWLKRCLRIWPLYFLFIITGLLLVWAARHFWAQQVSNIPPLLWLLTFTLNFYIIKHGQQFLFFILFLWSIAIEEQFYAIAGLLLKFAKKALVPFCILLIAASILFRFIYLNQSVNLYFNTLSWVGTFAAGSLLAHLCINKGKTFEKLKKIPRWVIAFVYILFILNFAFYTQIFSSDIMTVFERLSASLFFSFIIFEQSFCENHLFQLGQIPFINYLGRISYGLFCYHGLIILLFEKITLNIQSINTPLAVFLINPVIIFVFTVIVSALSYQYFEKPIMALRYKLKTA